MCQRNYDLRRQGPALAQVEVVGRKASPRPCSFRPPPAALARRSAVSAPRCPYCVSAALRQRQCGRRYERRGLTRGLSFEPPASQPQNPNSPVTPGRQCISCRYVAVRRFRPPFRKAKMSPWLIGCDLDFRQGLGLGPLLGAGEFRRRAFGSDLEPILITQRL